MRKASWPEHSFAADPFHDEPAARSGYEDYVARGGTEDRDRYEHLAKAFIADLSAGARPHDLEMQARVLLVWAPPHNDRRTELPSAPWIPSEGDAARIAADFCPIASAEAADRILGPLALTLDAHTREHRACLLAAFAQHAFLLADGAGRELGRSFDPGSSGYDQWIRRKPRPSAERRAAMRAVFRAPYSAWILHRRVGELWVVDDLVGLAAGSVPTEPIDIRVPGLPIREARPGDTLLARLVRGPDGWVAFAPIVIPGGPPRQKVQTWMHAELLRGRLTKRSLTVDALLRRRGHVLARRVCEWAWVAGDDDPYGLGPLYDLEYVDHTEDMDFYTDLAHEAQGPVVELGCGTGRLLLALAAAGIQVHGVDRSPTMLNQLKEKLARQGLGIRGRVTFGAGDFQTWKPNRRYPLVLLPFNAIHHCRHRDEVLAMLAVVRSAMAPDGLFALDCYLPDLELYDRDPDQRFEERIFEDPRTGDRLHSWEQGWWDDRTAVHHVIYVYRDDEGREERAHLQFSMYELDELRELFREGGFELVSEARDFTGSPLLAGSLKWVGVLR